MAKVQMDELVDHLSSEIRRALEDTLAEHFPNAQVDAHEVFRTFRRAVRRKCSTWETVPDQYVEKD